MIKDKEDKSFKYKFIRWVRFRYGRFKVKLTKKFESEHNLTKIQTKTMQITYSLMSDLDSELLSNPNDNKCYITKHDESGELLIFITIQKATHGCIINIIGKDLTGATNSRYHYDIWYDEFWTTKIMNRFYRILSRRRNIMEDAIRKGDEDNLDTIYKHIQNLTNKNEQLNGQKI